jgi:hypothetical protein
MGVLVFTTGCVALFLAIEKPSWMVGSSSRRPPAGPVLDHPDTGETSTTKQRLIDVVRDLRGEQSGGRRGADDEAPNGPSVAYVFAHHTLRQLAFEDPVRFLSNASGPDGPGFLRSVWESVRRLAKADKGLPPDFSVHPLELGDDRGIVIELPAPRRPAEAYLVAFTTRPIRPGERAIPSVRRLARYFTLEKGPTGLVEGLRRTGACGLPSFETVLGE